MNLLENWELRMMDLEEKLRPIAKRTVDITRPGWFERLQAGGQPLDEAGVRDAVERLLAEIIAGYAQGTDQSREALRRLFQEYSSLAWAATLPVPRTTLDGLRQHLILFSIEDQGRDSRDALLTLQEICKDAGNAGLEMAPVLREVAGMSSDADKFGMGSTRQMLLRCLLVRTS